MFTCAQVIRSGVIYANPSFEGEPGWLYTGCGLFGFAISFLMAGMGEVQVLTGRKLLQMAFLGVLLEAPLLLVLPSHLALTQYRLPEAVQWSSVVGIWGVSFLLYLSNLLVTQLILSRGRSAPEDGMALRWTAVALAAVVAVTAAGPLVRVREEGPVVAVAAVQSNDEGTLLKLSREAYAQGAKLAVWPEFGGQILAPGGDTTKMREMARAPGTPAFVTSFPDGNAPLPHNAASLFSASGESERYYKRKLFGGEKNMHTPGTKGVSAAFGETPIGLNVCYDSCFPAIIRDTVREAKAAILTLPTIDPTSPHGFVEAVHAAFTPFRSAETGRPMVRADGNAFSMITDASGMIVAESGAKPDQVVQAEVQTSSSVPLATRFGEWFLWASLIGFVGTVVLGVREKRRMPTETVEDRLETFGREVLEEVGAGR